MPFIVLKLLKVIGPKAIILLGLLFALWAFHHQAYQSGFDDAVTQAQLERQQAIDVAIAAYKIKRDKQQSLAVARIQRDQSLQKDKQQLQRQVTTYVEKNDSQHDCVIDDDGLQLVNVMVEHANRGLRPAESP